MNRRIKTTPTIRTMTPPAAPAIKPMGRPFYSVWFSVLDSVFFSLVVVVIVGVETDGLVFEPEFEVFELV